MTTVSKAEASAALQAILALSEAIRELGSVPVGHLYETASHHMDLQTFESFITRIVNTGLVRRTPHHLLV